MRAVTSAHAVEGFFRRVAISDGLVLVTAQFFELAEQHVGSLPAKAQEYIDAFKTYRNVHNTIKTLDAGNVVGVLQLTAALTACHSLCWDPVKLKPEVQKWKDLIHQQWNKAWEMLASKLRLEAPRAYIKKYTEQPHDIREAIRAWNFEHFPWLSSKTADETRTAESKAMDAFVTQMGCNLRSLGELHSQVTTMTWLTEPQRKEMTELAEQTEAMKAVGATVADLMSQIILANAILTEGSIESFKHYAATRLGVPMKSMPKSIQDRLPQKGVKRPIASDEGMPPPSQDAEKPKARRLKR